MRNKIITLILILVIFTLIINSSSVQAQSQTLTQFGNLNYNSDWNLSGGVIIASQFSIQQSITVTWMSVCLTDNAPFSFIRLGIFSDNNNQPYECLASTTRFPLTTNPGWYKLPLSQSITLQAGTYWLTEVDSGAGVIKYLDSTGLTLTMNTDYLGGTNFFAPLDMGNEMPTPLHSVSGTLAIIASNGPPSIPNTQPPPTYAEYAQCWVSSSNTDPSIQTNFETGKPVYIYWTPQNPSDGVIDISIAYPQGVSPNANALVSFFNLASEDAPVSFVPNYPGTWTIFCNGYSTSIAVLGVKVTGDYFVVTEYPLGGLLAIIACFASFGFVTIRRRRSKYRVATV
jgi:hypothetical protein